MNLPLTAHTFRKAAFSLVEILVVAALLTLIILALLGMFQQTHKAWRVGMTQTDVLESGRATMQMIVRELEQMCPAYSTGLNFFAVIPYPRNEQDLPGPPDPNTGKPVIRRNHFHDFLFLTRENQAWKGIGYRIDSSAQNSGFGTLLRYETNFSYGVAPVVSLSDFYSTSPDHVPVTPGVVHFKIQAYDIKGVLITNDFRTTPNQDPGIIADADVRPSTGAYAPGEIGYYAMTNRAVPAYVEFEMGIIEPRAQERVRSLAEVPSAASNYLAQQATRTHLFRQRVTVHNVDRSAYPQP